MIRYYKLFDLLNRRNMNKSDLLEILSSKTIAKLSKGANMNTDIIDKICLFLECQPSDIMEVVEVVDEFDENTRLVSKSHVVKQAPSAFSAEEHFIETHPTGKNFEESDEEGETNRQYLQPEDTPQITDKKTTRKG